MVNGVVIGKLSSINETLISSEKDDYNIGNIGNVSVGVQSGNLLYHLPTIKTSSKIMPSSITGAYGSSDGLIGDKFRINYEYTIQYDDKRIVLTNYMGISSYYIYVDSADVLKEIGIDPDLIIGDIFINSTDQSYIHKNG